MEEYWQTVTNALSLQVSLAIFVIYNVRDLVVGDKITVGVGIPLQLAWSILGWFAVSTVFLVLHQGMKLIFFSDSRLAPKFFKVVANSKKVGSKTSKPFFFCSRPSKIKLGKRSLTCYKVDTRMDDIQCFSSPKSKMASSYQSIEEVCCGFIFTNIFDLLYLLVRLWWNILVTNLVTNFRDLVAKVKNLITLVPVFLCNFMPCTVMIMKQAHASM